MAKKTVSADDILRQMYPDLPTSDDFKPAAAAGASAEPTIAELQAQITALKAGNYQAASKPIRGRPLDLPVAPTRPVFDLSKAPDPIQQPQDYAAFVRQMTEADISYEKKQYQWEQQAQKATADRVVGLWDDFSGAYGAYGKDPKKVEVAAAQVVNKKNAAGVNTNKYMFEDTDSFFNDVTKEYDELFGKPKPVLEGAGDNDDDEDNRGVVSGGGVGSTAPVNVARPPEKFGALGSDLDAWQQRTGFYR